MTHCCFWAWDMKNFLAGLLCIWAAAAQAGPVYTGGWFGQGAAIKGYDPVAYFTENRAVKGQQAFTAEFDGAQWLFASAQHRDLFLAEPEKYRPQYGGFCAYALGAKNDLVKVDPRIFTIVDGRLFLNYSAAVRADWLEQRDAFIKQADQNWLQHRDN